MKRVLIIVLALLIGLSVLSACGGLEDPPPLPSPRVRSASTPTPPMPTAPPPAPPTTAPTAAPPGEDPDNDAILVIPERGGAVLVQEEMLVSFTPGWHGVWEIFTTDSGSSDPYIELLDDRGNRVWFDDDSGGDYDARIIYFLKGGTEYKINVRFFSASETTTLVVNNPYIIDFPNTGGVLDVWQDTYFLFIPARSGSWLFETSDNGDSDPVLELYDAYGDWIAGDDDGGDGLNARFTATIEEGKEYFISARFYGFDPEYSYTLTVSPNH